MLDEIIAIYAITDDLLKAVGHQDTTGIDLASQRSISACSDSKIAVASRR